MNVIISDKTYNIWNEPILPTKRSKIKIVEFIIYDNFQGSVSDIIVISKYKYQWILKGCKLIRHEDITDRFLQDSPPKRTKLTISFEERFGSHIKGVIESEIRDYVISKVLKTD